LKIESLRSSDQIKKAMKMANKIVILAFLLLLGSVMSSFAQVSANASVTVNLITPIAITKTVDMNFGNVAVSGTGGTVVLPPVGPRTLTGGVTLPVVSGTVSAASFTVTGLSTYTFSISLPSSPITIKSGANSMTVGTFTSNPATTGTLTGGTTTLDVGATLNVGANQPAGTYISETPFTVTVNYN
jgi:hypothetical protein